MSAFKYRSLADLKRFLDIIVNKRLYGATYLSLNDPMEGQFDFELSKDLPHSAVQQLFDERSQTRICSLSQKHNSKDIPNNGILWSMYADEHRGCCIEVELADPKWKEITVYYSELPPIVDSPYVQVIDILSIKLNQWKYEDEVRYICTEPQSPYVKVNIKAVYLGIRMSKEDVEFYTSLIHSIDKNIVVRQLKRNEIKWVR